MFIHENNLFTNPNNASLKRNKYTKKYLFYKNILLHLHKYVITNGVPTSQRTLLDCFILINPCIPLPHRNTDTS